MEGESLRGVVRRSPRPTVRCMDCEDFDILDMYCLSYHKDIVDPYDEIQCRRFNRIRVVVRSKSKK